MLIVRLAFEVKSCDRVTESLQHLRATDAEVDERVRPLGVEDSFELAPLIPSPALLEGIINYWDATAIE